MIVVVSVMVLLLEIGSVVTLVTVAVFTMLPVVEPLTVTTMVREMLLPALRPDTVQVTMLLPISVQPPVAQANMIVEITEVGDEIRLILGSDALDVLANE